MTSLIFTYGAERLTPELTEIPSKVSHAIYTELYRTLETWGQNRAHCILLTAKEANTYIPGIWEVKTGFVFKAA